MCETCFKLQEHWIKSQRFTWTQLTSSCLEVDHFGETATGIVKLGQHFLLKMLEKHIFPKNLVVHTIRIGMHRFVFILSMLEMCQLYIYLNNSHKSK